MNTCDQLSSDVELSVEELTANLIEGVQPPLGRRVTEDEHASYAKAYQALLDHGLDLAPFLIKTNMNANRFRKFRLDDALPYKSMSEIDTAALKECEQILAAVTDVVEGTRRTITDEQRRAAAICHRYYRRIIGEGAVAKTCDISKLGQAQVSRYVRDFAGIPSSALLPSLFPQIIEEEADVPVQAADSASDEAPTFRREDGNGQGEHDESTPAQTVTDVVESLRESLVQLEHMTGIIEQQKAAESLEVAAMRAQITVLHQRVTQNEEVTRAMQETIDQMRGALSQSPTSTAQQHMNNPDESNVDKGNRNQRIEVQKGERTIVINVM
jgi:hypothetical protein